MKIWMIRLLEHSAVLIDGVSKTVRHEIKKNKKVDFLVCY